MNKFTTFENYAEEVSSVILTENGNCPVIPVICMLQGKWKLQIIYELCIKSPMRFGELKKVLSGITNTMLTNALRELETDDLVHSLTEKGKDLLPIFYEITKFGLKYIP